MSWRPEPIRSEAFGDGSAQQAGNNIFRIVGGWGNVSGPGIFMVRAMVAGSTAAVCVGMTGAVLGAMLFGSAALPFITAASAGFILGTTRFYSDSLTQAMICLDAYPALLRLHLDANYPSRRFRKWQLDAFRSQNFRQSYGLQSMLIVAWLTAQPALDEVRSHEENAIIEEERDKSTSKRETE